jgi:hypothetical protein
MFYGLRPGCTYQRFSDDLMDSQFIARIKKELGLRETEDLQALLAEHDQAQWAEETFEAVRQILMERGAALPESAPPFMPSAPLPRGKRKQWVRRTAPEPELESEEGVAVEAWPEPIDPAEEFFLFAESELLPGFPGYRTRPNRSGYDYIDTQLELAHMTGVFLRSFFSGILSRFSPGIHPLIGLAVGVLLLIAFPGGWFGCPGMLIVLLMALFAPLLKHPKRIP